MTQTSKVPHVRASDFPADFLWGVSTSSYQIEGAWDEGGRSPSIWDTFSHTPGRTLNGDNGDRAVDHYHRYREDVALLADLGVGAYRFSISWSRLIPSGTGAVNKEGLDFYRRLCESLLAEGITPVVTLYHWDLPLSLQDRGGWLNPDSVDWFADYAGTAKEHLGDLVRVWSTINEPWCVAFLGHSAGEHAPGLRDPGSGFVTAHNLMLAHHAAIGVMRETNPHADDRLGIGLNLIPALPADDSPESSQAAAGVDAIQNCLFLDATFDGTYPERVLDYQRAWGVAEQIDLDRLQKVSEPVDYLGINYYNVNHIRHAPGSEPMPAWPGPAEAEVARPPGELTQMGWGVEPEGLTWMLERVHERVPELPLMILENGAAYPDEMSDNGLMEDPKRISYIRDHIAAIRDVRESGVNVVGYFIWSLLDNFEWARGYSKHFGIVHVDRETMKRTVKASGNWFRDFLNGDEPPD